MGTVRVGLMVPLWLVYRWSTDMYVPPLLRHGGNFSSGLVVGSAALTRRSWHAPPIIFTAGVGEEDRQVSVSDINGQCIAGRDRCECWAFPFSWTAYSPLQQNQPQLPFLFPYDFFDLLKKERATLSIPWSPPPFTLVPFAFSCISLHLNKNFSWDNCQAKFCLMKQKTGMNASSGEPV